MQKFLNLSIDLETLSLQTDAAVLQIAAVAFNTPSDLKHAMDTVEHAQGLKPLTDLTKQFLASISPSTYPCGGYHTDPETVAWWAQEKNAEARKIVFSGTETIWGAVGRFNEWLHNGVTDGIFPSLKELRIWMRNAPFDWNVLKNLMQLEASFPFHYRATREMYNILDHVPLHALPDATKRPGNLPHEALSDAYSQAVAIQCADYWKLYGTPLQINHQTFA